MLPLQISWTTEAGETAYRAPDYAHDIQLVAELPHGVLHPDMLGEAKTAVLKNTAQERRLEAVRRDGKTPEGTAETLVNVRLYLSMPEAASQVLLDEWPLAGAGVEISFDQGVSWTRFSRTCGYEGDPSTWIPLPGRAVCETANDGELGPFAPYNRATLQLRVRTPKNTAAYGIYTFSLVPDCDVL